MTPRYETEMPHHEIEQLLRYVDGELPSRATRKIRSHLKACWQCRAERDELENIVNECVSYRKNTLQRYLPSPPAPWIDIYQGFAEIDASTEPGIFDRAVRTLEWPVHNLRRWVPATLALLLICALFYWFRQTPTVQAAELLRKAISAADAQPVKSRRIEIRTKQHRLTRLTGPMAKPVLSASDQEAANSLQALFVAANFDWDDPLSAKSYQSWRDQLVDKRDEVIALADTFRVRTESSSGPLMNATLQLRKQDLHPFEERLEFRDREWVEITEMAEEPAPSPDPTAAAGGHETAKPATVPLPAPAVSATISDELHVLVALHQLGADLGDPIEISRSGGKVLVSGVGIAPQRQQEISDVLGSKPLVVIRFTESAPAAAQPQKETPTDSTVSPDVRQLQARISERIGGRVVFDQLAAQVLDLSESMMSRIYALRRLAERFPSAVESELSVQDLQLLRRLQKEHTAVLRQQASEIDGVLRPVLGTVRPAPDPGFAAWQPATENLFQSARHVEKLLAVMFGAAPGESSDGLPAQLSSSLAQLHTKLEAYNILLTQSPERRNR